MSGASSSAEDRLYGLMEIAERQQTAVQAALAGLEAERAALQREREALGRGVRDLQLGTQGAVRSAVKESLAGAATEGVAAVQAATTPLLGKLAGVAQEAEQAEAALRRVVRWASWRLLGWVLAGSAGLLVMGWFVSSLIVWRDGERIAVGRAQRAQLTAEIEEMQVIHDRWVKLGMLGRLVTCGPRERPCIRVDESAGRFGERSDHRVILGY